MRKAGRATALTSLTAGLSALAAAPLAGAQALPPPPYAADQGQYAQGQYAPGQSGQAGQTGQAGQAGPQMLDRYGGGYRHSAASAYQPFPGPGAPQGAPSGPRLAWAGKVEAQAPVAAAQPGGGWSSMTQRWNAEPQVQRQAQQAPRPPSLPRWAQPQAQPQEQPQTQPQALAASQPQGDTPAEMAARMPPPNNPWRPYRPQVQAQTQANRTPAPAPTSIYDAPPAPFRQAQAAPAPAPNAAPDTASNSQGGPRFYSLHKEYGIQPDPIPLPPQFFGPTADLSASVADPLSRRTTIVNGQAKTVNAPDDQGAQ